MNIEELIELTNKINRLKDILDILQQNDSLNITIKDEFVYGYGLDLKDYERNLTEIRYV